MTTAARTSSVHYSFVINGVARASEMVIDLRHVDGIAGASAEERAAILRRLAEEEADDTEARARTYARPFRQADGPR